MVLLIQSVCTREDLSWRKLYVKLACPCHVNDILPNHTLSQETNEFTPWKTALFRNKWSPIQVMFTKYQMPTSKKMGHDRTWNLCHWTKHGILWPLKLFPGGAWYLQTANVLAFGDSVPCSNQSSLSHSLLGLVTAKSLRKVNSRQTSQRTWAACREGIPSLPLSCSVRIPQLGSVLTYGQVSLASWEEFDSSLPIETT